MRPQIQSPSNSTGAVLPTVLGILLLLFVIGNQLTETVLTNHKTNSAYKAQLQAESLADYGLTATEQLILEQTSRPDVVSKVRAVPINSSQLLDGTVWQNNTSEFNLMVTQDALTQSSIDWTRQPVQWWQTYANKYTRNLSATIAQTAYSVIEEYTEDFSGSDLGQARDHYAAPSKVLYQVTAFSEGGAQGTSRVRTVVAKTFR